VKCAHDRQDSHSDTPAHKRVKPSIGSSRSPFASRSPSPMMVDSWTSSEEPPSMHPSVPSFSASSSSLPSSPLWFPSHSSSPERPNYHPTFALTPSLTGSPLRSLPSISSTISPPTSTRKKDLPWHHGLYCVDVVDGLERMNSKSLKGLPKVERFTAAFPGRRYVDSTVRDAQTQWARASNSAKEAALTAGQTTQGLWHVFSAQHPIKTKRSKGRG
jgi:hypothetical protein